MTIPFRRPLASALLFTLIFSLFQTPAQAGITLTGKITNLEALEGGKYRLTLTGPKGKFTFIVDPTTQVRGALAADEVETGQLVYPPDASATSEEIPAEEPVLTEAPAPEEAKLPEEPSEGAESAPPAGGPGAMPFPFPQKPQLPEIPKLPELPKVPEIPQVPEKPELPEKPQLPAMPERPELPQPPQMPELPERPKLPAGLPFPPPGGGAPPPGSGDEGGGAPPGMDGGEGGEEAGGPKTEHAAEEIDEPFLTDKNPLEAPTEEPVGTFPEGESDTEPEPPALGEDDGWGLSTVVDVQKKNNSVELELQRPDGGLKKVTMPPTQTVFQFFTAKDLYTDMLVTVEIPEATDTSVAKTLTILEF